MAAAVEFENEIVRALRQIMRAVDLHSRQLASRHGITTPQLVCLRALEAADESPTLRALAAEVSLSPATVGGIVDRLEARGLVRRDRIDADRRLVRVVLTEAGQRLAESAPSPLQETFLDRMRTLDVDQREQILTSLQRIVRMMDGERIDAAPLLAAGPLPDGDRAAD